MGSKLNRFPILFAHFWIQNNKQIWRFMLVLHQKLDDIWRPENAHLLWIKAAKFNGKIPRIHLAYALNFACQETKYLNQGGIFLGVYKWKVTQSTIVTIRLNYQPIIRNYKPLPQWSNLRVKSVGTTNWISQLAHLKANLGPFRVTIFWQIPIRKDVVKAAYYLRTIAVSIPMIIKLPFPCPNANKKKMLHELHVQTRRLFSEHRWLK